MLHVICYLILLTKTSEFSGKIVDIRYYELQPVITQVVAASNPAQNPFKKLKKPFIEGLKETDNDIHILPVYKLRTFKSLLSVNQDALVV